VRLPLDHQVLSPALHELNGWIQILQTVRPCRQSSGSKSPIAACPFLEVKQGNARFARNNFIGGAERHARLDRVTLCACEIIPRGCARIGEKDICDIHRRVVRSQEGIRSARYRETDVWLLSPDRRRVYPSPPWEEVPDLMHRFAKWLRVATASQPIVFTAALAHLQLVTIHPFEDGNGRTARALACLLIARARFIPADFCLERIFGRPHSKEYSLSIDAALGQERARQFDATPFVAHFTRALSAAVRARVCSIDKLWLRRRLRPRLLGGR
jgi:Fic family protein